MKRARYEDNQTVNIGFPNTDNAIYLAEDTASDAFSGDVVVRVVPELADVWVAIGTDPTATAKTDGSMLVQFGTNGIDIGIDKNDKIIATGPINVIPYK
jgi:hypothetical protein